ncbi:1,4-dihydroxy-2-naphthoate polyprenyltransferase [Termitidicoccus mucosus]|uniref:1,4-dihydroxy-2-naphthoate octaprenyltransferase n=1 Tax=Termitidicoccus mucosus TaxID=1184151 RepID=A0A178IGD5_9BACT|nr:1,4-dihydroxy-2-naphthoate octaprenyltransferase [Opitutaceae bacterium TSB47]
MTERPSSFQIWFQAARPRTLPAAVAPVLAGSALAWHDGGFQAAAACACLAFALLIQIGTNFANDYYDHKKGADTAERVGPRRAVAMGWVRPATMRAAMWLVFAAAFLAGLTLLRFGGWPLLAIGVTSILCGIAYTGGPFPLAYNGLGDVFVFVFFGLVAVGATYFVQTGTLTLDAMLVASAIGLLSVNILLVNNYRDMETDAKAGKRTLIVRFGRGVACVQFCVSLALALGVTAVLWVRGFSAWVMLPLLLAPLAVSHARRLRRDTGPAQRIALLGDTGKLLALYALLLAAGLAM